MSLYENINKRKAAGTSRTKAKSTVSAKSYSKMKAGFPKKTDKYKFTSQRKVYQLMFRISFSRHLNLFSIRKSIVFGVGSVVN